MLDLCLAEYAWQIRDMRSRGLNGDWVALGPQAMWELQKAGQPFTIPEDYYCLEDYGLFCQGNHARLIEICKDLDQTVQKRHKELAELGIRPFTFNLVPLFELLDGSLGRLYQLKALLNGRDSAHVFAHLSPAAPWGEYLLGFANQETIYSSLLMQPGWGQLNFHPLEFSSEARSAQEQKAARWSLRKATEGAILLYSSLCHLRRGRWREALRCILRKGDAVLVINVGNYDWQGFVPYLSMAGLRVLLCDSRDFQPPKPPPPVSCTTLQASRELAAAEHRFTYQGVSAWPLVRDRFVWLLEDAPAGLLKLADNVRRIVRQQGIRAVLTISCGDVISHTINQAARKAGAAVVVWQHGMVMQNRGINELYQYCDLMTADLTLAYGQASAEAYKNFGKGFDSRVEPVGSFNLSLFKENLLQTVPQRDGIPKVLFATSLYNQNTWVFNADMRYSDRLYCRDQEVIIERLCQLANRGAAEVWVKVHPSYRFMDPPWLEAIQGENIKVFKEAPSLKELLPQVDAVLLDLPATSLLEALCTRAGIFVLLSHFRYGSEDIRRLERRAVCAWNPAGLMRELEAYLDHGQYPADFKDQTFLRAFSVDEDGFEIAGRVMRLLDGLPTMLKERQKANY